MAAESIIPFILQVAGHSTLMTLLNVVVPCHRRRWWRWAGHVDNTEKLAAGPKAI
jgi:hypothetical protein